MIGRIEERKRLNLAVEDDKSHFIALYGRRRVGKTFLIKEYFENKFSFYCTGLLKGNKRQQLSNFTNALDMQFSNFEPGFQISNWFEAFNSLISALSTSEEKGKKVIFIDEMPWMDTIGSDFILGLEYFWNSWASSRKDIVFIVCGSATTWMVGKIFNNTGGLYNRVTTKMKIDPFTLQECTDYFEEKGFKYSTMQCVEVYMVFGGIPFYLDQFHRDLSPFQNIDRLLFGQNAMFTNEYDLLFKSLFKNHESHIAVIKAISQKNKGIDRSSISKFSGLSDGGSLTKILNNLEHSSFIRKYRSIHKKSKDTIYQLIDPFCLFHNNMKEFFSEENFWIKNYSTPKYHNWSGYAFEIVCINHISHIKAALGISGIQSQSFSWSNAKTQIDLIIDRADNVINLCEMKFTQGPFTITKKYDGEIRNKIQQFLQFGSGKKAIWPVIICPFGLAKSPYNNLFIKILDANIFIK